jgi:hypothetical protein
MYLTGAGKEKNLNDPDSVDTLVDKDVVHGVQHLMELAMRGGPWGDPDGVMIAARHGGSSGGGGGGGDVDANIKNGAAAALIAMEMKATLGYSFATSSSGWLWNVASAETKKTLSELCVNVAGSVSIEGTEESGNIEGHDAEERSFRFEPILGAADNLSLEHHEQRAVKWWLSAAVHHGDVPAGKDALLFVGEKYAEKGYHDLACHQFAQALATLSPSSSSTSWSKVLGIIGWHLLLHRPCSQQDMESIASGVGVESDSIRNIHILSYSETAAVVLNAAAHYERIAGMRFVWSFLSHTASAVSFVL